MKTNELRIGNIVLDFRGIENTVSSIEKEGKVEFEDGTKCLISECNPVLVRENLFSTDELEHGIDAGGMQFFFCEEKILPEDDFRKREAHLEISDSCWGYGLNVEIKFVHSFQNAYFDLNGREFEFYKKR